MKHPLSVALVATTMLIFATLAGAADANHLRKLSALKQCKNCDLSGAPLQFAALKNADLSGSNLSGASLKGADLSGATLKGANLSNADLSESDLNGTDLADADLKGANLYSVNLLRANLTGADLSTAVNAGEKTVAEAFLCHTKLASGTVDRDCK